MTNLMEAAMEVFNDSLFVTISKPDNNQTCHFDIFDNSKMFYQAVSPLL